MPAVRRFIANMTGLAPTGIDGGVDPDEAVALGAAVQVGSIAAISLLKHFRVAIRLVIGACAAEAWRFLCLEC